MNPFESWAAAIENRGVRSSLMLLGLLATIAFGPSAAFGVYMLVIALASEAPDRFQFLGWWLSGAAGLAGLVGAWLRVLVPRERLKQSAPLRRAVMTLLVAGLLMSGALLIGSLGDLRSPVSLVWLFISAIGAFLLGSTIGIGGRAP